MKICAVCGNEIEFESRARKYCSEQCRKTVKYKRDRAWLAARPGKANEYSRKWREENPEITKQMGRDAYRRKCAEKLKEDQDNA